MHSEGHYNLVLDDEEGVLILVLMEDALGAPLVTILTS